MEYFTYGDKEINYLKKRDKVLGKYIESVGIINREVNRDVFGALIESIISQQISNKAAETVTSRLQNVAAGFKAESINAISVEEIKKCGMSTRKAEYIKNAASAAFSREIDFSKLGSLSDDEVIKSLVQIKGVGVWTAQMLLTFSLCWPDVISYDDLAIRRGIMSLYSLDVLLKKEFNRYREIYSPYGTVAALYLWNRSVE